MLKTKITFPLLVVLFSFFVSCSQELDDLSPTAKNDLKTEITLNEAQKWYELKMGSVVLDPSFQTNYVPPKVIWSESIAKNLSLGKGLLIPVEFAENSIPIITSKSKQFETTLPRNNRNLGMNELSNLLMYKDKEGNIQAEIVTNIFDDGYYNRKVYEPYKFSGYVWVRNIDGTFLKGFNYKDGNNIGDLLIGDNKNAKQDAANLFECGQVAQYVTVCVPAINYCDYHFSHFVPIYCSENSSTTTTGLMSGDYTTTGGGVSTYAAPVLTYDSFSYGGNYESPIVNPLQELKCFMSNSNSGFTYKIEICAQQPLRGTKSAFYGSNVGHTFIHFTKINNANGQKIDRSVGFYPANGPKSILVPVPSVIKDNSATLYDASLSYDVSATQFTNGVNTALAWSNQNYDLASFNCTDAAYNVFSAAGLNVPMPWSKLIMTDSDYNTTIALTLHSPGGLGFALLSLPNQSGRTVDKLGGRTGKNGGCN